MDSRYFKYGIMAFFMGFLLVLILMGTTSCGKGPKVTIYISNPQKSGMDFYNENNNTKGFVDYSKTDKFICMNQTDLQSVMNYCGAKK